MKKVEIYILIKCISLVFSSTNFIIVIYVIFFSLIIHRCAGNRYESCNTYDNNFFHLTITR